MACKSCGKSTSPVLLKNSVQIPQTLMAINDLITVARGKKGQPMQIRLDAFLAKYASRLIKTFGSLQVINISKSLSEQQVADLVKVCKELGVDVAEKYLNNNNTTPPPPAAPIDLVAKRAAKIKEQNEVEKPETGVPESVVAATPTKKPTKRKTK